MANTCMFMHTVRRIMVVVHGDDFVCLGEDADIEWFNEQMATAYEHKRVGNIGPELNDDKSMKILNRVLTWTDEGLEFEADQRHAEIVVQMLGLGGCREVSTPGAKEEATDGDQEPVEGEEATLFRAAAARINYLAQDRPELLYAAKEVCRLNVHTNGRGDAQGETDRPILGR